MNEPIPIEDARATDAESLAELAQSCGLHIDVAAELGRDFTWFLVARAPGGAVCGLLLAWRAVDELHVTDLGVSEAFRRRGLARALLAELVRRGRAEGARVIFLEVRESNEPARALYASEGFEAIDERLRYYSDTGESAIVLRRELEEERQ